MKRTNLSPFTKDFRGEEQCNESKDRFFMPCYHSRVTVVMNEIKRQQKIHRDPLSNEFVVFFCSYTLDAKNKNNSFLLLDLYKLEKKKKMLKRICVKQ